MRAAYLEPAQRVDDSCAEEQSLYIIHRYSTFFSSVH